jgi:hypothetical protein
LARIFIYATLSSVSITLLSLSSLLIGLAPQQVGLHLG